MQKFIRWWNTKSNKRLLFKLTNRALKKEKHFGNNGKVNLKSFNKVLTPFRQPLMAKNNLLKSTSYLLKPILNLSPLSEVTTHQQILIGILSIWKKLSDKQQSSLKSLKLHTNNAVMRLKITRKWLMKTWKSWSRIMEINETHDT